MNGIYRIDQTDPEGHFWRVSLKRQNRHYTRTFRYGRYGGTAQALAAPQAYRDDLSAEHPLTLRHRPKE